MCHRLRPRDVHVHCARVNPAGGIAPVTASALSPGELARASRFVRVVDRMHFEAAHALLRRTLSRYADVPPHAWTFDADQFGKPALGGAHAGRLAFNLTHASGLVACAVGPAGLAIGIDAEPIERPMPDLLGLARRFFSGREYDGLERCPEDRRPERFIELWTLKEAFVKAVGSGLSHPLDSFGFDMDEGGRLEVYAASTEPRAWRVAMYAPTETHRLALAVAGTGADEASIQVWVDDARVEDWRPIVSWAGRVPA